MQLFSFALIATALSAPLVSIRVNGKANPSLPVASVTSLEITRGGSAYIYSGPSVNGQCTGKFLGRVNPGRVYRYNTPRDQFTLGCIQAIEPSNDGGN